jgi:hypothetical protein
MAVVVHNKTFSPDSGPIRLRMSFSNEIGKFDTGHDDAAAYMFVIVSAYPGRCLQVVGSRA